MEFNAGITFGRAERVLPGAERDEVRVQSRKYVSLSREPCKRKERGDARRRPLSL
jgi:hypothetical protein